MARETETSEGAEVLGESTNEVKRQDLGDGSARQSFCLPTVFLPSELKDAIEVAVSG